MAQTKHLPLQDQSLKQLREYFTKLAIAILKKQNNLDKVLIRITGNKDSLYQYARFNTHILPVMQALKEDGYNSNSKYYWTRIIIELQLTYKHVHHIPDYKTRHFKRQKIHNDSKPNIRIPSNSLGHKVVKSKNGKSKLSKQELQTIDYSEQIKRYSRDRNKHHSNTKLKIVLSDRLGNTYRISIVTHINTIIDIGYLRLLSDNKHSLRLDNLPIDIVWDKVTILEHKNIIKTSLADIDSKVIKVYKQLVKPDYIPEKQPTREYKLNRSRSNKNNNVRNKIICVRDRIANPDKEHDTRIDKYTQIVKSDRRSNYLQRIEI